MKLGEIEDDDRRFLLLLRGLLILLLLGIMFGNNSCDFVVMLVYCGKFMCCRLLLLYGRSRDVRPFCCYLHSYLIFPKWSLLWEPVLWWWLSCLLLLWWPFCMCLVFSIYPISYFVDCSYLYCLPVVVDDNEVGKYPTLLLVIWGLFILL